MMSYNTECHTLTTESDTQKNNLMFTATKEDFMTAVHKTRKKISYPLLTEFAQFQS